MTTLFDLLLFDIGLISAIITFALFCKLMAKLDEREEDRSITND